MKTKGTKQKNTNVDTTKITSKEFFECHSMEQMVPVPSGTYADQPRIGHKLHKETRVQRNANVLVMVCRSKCFFMGSKIVRQRSNARTAWCKMDDSPTVVCINAYQLHPTAPKIQWPDAQDAIPNGITAEAKKTSAMAKLRIGKLAGIRSARTLKKVKMTITLRKTVPAARNP